MGRGWGGGRRASARSCTTAVLGGPLSAAAPFLGANSRRLTCSDTALRPSCSFWYARRFSTSRTCAAGGEACGRRAGGAWEGCKAGGVAWVWVDEAPLAGGWWERWAHHGVHALQLDGLQLHRLRQAICRVAHVLRDGEQRVFEVALRLRKDLLPVLARSDVRARAPLRDAGEVLPACKGRAAINRCPCGWRLARAHWLAASSCSAAGKTWYICVSSCETSSSAIFLSGARRLGPFTLGPFETARSVRAASSFTAKSARLLRGGDIIIEDRG